MSFKHLQIEKHWQTLWESQSSFAAKLDKKRPKYYVLDMFPYPSSQGLHVGHPAGYTATDVVARFKRAKGFNVLHPMGYDAFGLPAEQFAIQTGVHPSETTRDSIFSFRRQLKALGYSYDWSREISTCDPNYYKWTQYIFGILYQKGLAYQLEVPVNWCPELRTVLANEEVIDGKSERGNHPVVRVPMKQWMLKITAYAERLLADLDKIDWPERTKEGQRNWIGKSEGLQIRFNVPAIGDSIEIFTTRPDTIFGASFLVVAPEHPLVSILTTPKQKALVSDYCQWAISRSEVDRQANLEKTGVFTGGFALNPFSQEAIPIWVADYVLMGYGTGAIMAVPAHDERDFAFAKNFGLKIIQVIETRDLPYSGEGKLESSGEYSGMESTLAKKKIIEDSEKRGVGQRKINYRLRDWLFSRQRYWGEPFPIIYNLEKKLAQVVPIEDLPVLLPQVSKFEPNEKGESPLASAKEWLTVLRNGEEWVRETDTMPGSAGSSWYFLRYADPKNEDAPFGFEEQKYWMPVDLYLGGAEHTVGHLLYSRFWQKVLFDAGLVSHDEPFKKLVHQGMILGIDGEKMSKSRGNVVNPDHMIHEYGADALRIYICFMGPLEKDKPWSETGIQGARRFLERVWRLVFSDPDGNDIIAEDQEVPMALDKLLHKTISKVTEDIETLNLNTAISQMMILVNEMYRLNLRPRSLLLTLSQLLMPFAPHISETIWTRLKGDGLVSLSTWPAFDPTKVKDDTVTMAVQINGKKRGTIEASDLTTQEEALKLALNIDSVKTALAGAQISQVIYKSGKILSIIAK